VEKFITVSQASRSFLLGKEANTKVVMPCGESMVNNQTVILNVSEGPLKPSLVLPSAQLPFQDSSQAQNDIKHSE
jgi:hypothetical protein